MLKGLRRAMLLCGVPAILFLAGGTAAAAPEQPQIVNRGWGIVEIDGKKYVELRALVVNPTDEPLKYEVRFIVEAGPASAKAEVKTARGEAAGRDTEEQSRRRVYKVKGGPLAPGASEPVKVTFPYEETKPGVALRFSAELVDLSTGAVLGAAAITAIHAPFIGAAVAGAGLLAASGAFGGGDGEETITASGSGTMEGEHTAQWVGDGWQEQGSGTITVTGPGGTMVINYTYQSQGPNVSELVATATGSGTLTKPDSSVVPVEITTATAQMQTPGDRIEAGGTITRSGSFATGTFSGTVGGVPWTGVITMSNGVMTWDSSSGAGVHTFDIQFTASR